MLPDCGAMLRQLGIRETRVGSMRKAIGELKREPFDFVLCEFEYSYGNDYAGVTISNLDVMLYSLQKYSPDSKIIVVVQKNEMRYIDKLTELFAIHAVLQYPVSDISIRNVLQAAGSTAEWQVLLRRRFQPSV